jgi:hypothetical protein
MASRSGTIHPRKKLTMDNTVEPVTPIGDIDTLIEELETEFEDIRQIRAVTPPGEGGDTSTCVASCSCTHSCPC